MTANCCRSTRIRPVCLLGTTFGGDGTNFALPDLRGRVPIHVGGSHTLGERGEQAHTLSIAEIPTHTHVLSGSPSNANSVIAAGNVLAAANNVYNPPANLVALGGGSVANIGGSQVHQHAAVCTPEFLDCPAGHLSKSDLEE